MVIIRPLSIPLSGIRFQDGNTEAYLGDEVLGRGCLYITEETILWIKQSGGEGFNIQYKNMTLHAISRDPNVHPRSCMYIMINGTLDEDQVEILPSPDDEEETTEVRFVPEDSTRLDEMYKAVQDCTLLHPDASSDMSASGSDSEDEGNSHDDYEPAMALPLYGLGEPGARIFPGLTEEEERQIGALQNHFGDRLRFADPSAGNGHQSQRNGDQPRDPDQPFEFDPDQFQDPE